MKLFFPNLDFEEQLFTRSTRPTAQTSRSLAELAPLMALMAGPGDVVLCPRGVDVDQIPKSLKHTEIVTDLSRTTAEFFKTVPWGWSPQAVDMALQNGMPREQIPGLDAVKRVNSRKFSAEFDSLICEQSERFPFGAGAFGRLCRNKEECESAVSTFKKCGYERWIAKPQFSHAGRNRLLANGWDLNAAQSGWLTKQLRDPCGVYMEPWVESLNQAGLQFQIRNPAAGGPDIRCIGVTQLLTDHVGRYLGSIFALNAELEEAWKPAVEHGYRVCEAAAAAGYFGPIGIDCFRFRTTDGFIATRVCNDINARHTMGRLALQLRPQLLPGEYGLWCQVTSVQFSGFLAALQESLSDAGFGDVRAEGTSPKMMGIDPVRTGTVFFAGKSIAQLLKLSETLQAR